MTVRKWISLHLLFLGLLFCGVSARAQGPSHTLHANGKAITLRLPARYDVRVAQDGLHRVRFFAKSPDGRVFVTDMFSLADNTRGQVLILEGWNAEERRFVRAVPYLEHLRNPNSIAFFRDGSGTDWLYVALTDRLVRYRYRAGEMHPATGPEVLAHYPDYGLSYKYGGWHLTRTVVFGRVAGRWRMFVSVGSSCNACIEREPVRATITVMDPDGSHATVLVQNVRNAVGLLWDDASASLFATNMGDDQLGDAAPSDTLLRFNAAAIAAVEASGRPFNAGWPACYAENGTLRPDPVFGRNVDACKGVVQPAVSFAAHSSPLGLVLQPGGALLVALHGAGHPRIGNGYRLVTVTGQQLSPTDFMTGFLQQAGSANRVAGRPCGLLQLDAHNLLVSDDALGAVYVVFRADGH